MNEVKPGHCLYIKREEMPVKFREWLLSMGCPLDIVPSEDQVSEMCRGEYYMVWRSMMERIQSRQVVRRNRLQVFCDDFRKFKENNIECDKSATVNEQLSHWKQRTELHKKVEETKARVLVAHRELDQLLDKIASKVHDRSTVCKKLKDKSRRVRLLRQVAEDLKTKNTNLQETRSIAESLCSPREDADIQGKLDKCLLSSHPTQCQGSEGEVGAGSLPSDEWEKLVDDLAHTRGGELCDQLLERRAALVAHLDHTDDTTERGTDKAVCVQSVVARTAALHSLLALEATKNKLHLSHIQDTVFDTLLKLNFRLSSPEEYELVVALGERASVASREETLRALLGQLHAGTGPFLPPGPAERHIPEGDTCLIALTNDIENKNNELEEVISTLANTEHETQAVREAVGGLLSTLSDHSNLDHNLYTGFQMQVPLELIPDTRQFYAERRGREGRANVSMQLEEESLGNDTDYNNPTFVDELQIYLKKFCLENNRLLVLENGEKIWECESVECAERAIQGAGLQRGLRDVTARACARALRDVIAGAERPMAELHVRNVPNIDITSQIEEEEQITDRTKKQLEESLLEVQKTKKVYQQVEENLKFWENNSIKKYISNNRKIDGMTYKDYEVYYNENCSSL